jgi:hypothetical protein
MQADTVKLWFTYAIAFVVIVGGGVMLFITRTDPDPANLQLLIAGFIGAAITFVFGAESATRATRAAQSSAAAATASPPSQTPGP